MILYICNVDEIVNKIEVKRMIRTAVDMREWFVIFLKEDLRNLCSILPINIPNDLQVYREEHYVYKIPIRFAINGIKGPREVTKLP